MSYPRDLECPSCGASNKDGNNVEELDESERFCHSCQNLWEDPLAITEED